MGCSLPLQMHVGFMSVSAVLLFRHFGDNKGNRSFRCFKWTVKQSANFTVILFVYMHAISLTRIDSQHQVHFQKEGQPRADSESRVVLGGITGM